VKQSHKVSEPLNVDNPAQYMKTKNVVLAGIVGTSFMTLFSYIVSVRKRKNFKEPELLTDLGARLIKPADKSTLYPAGWATHYATGIGISLACQRLFPISETRLIIKNGVIIGIVTGLAGALVWKSVFNLHPDPPHVDFKRFYRHLLFAHLVFGLTMTISLRCISKR
jgi:hypothetical protein